MLIKNGVIYAKWHANDFPDASSIDKNFDGKVLAAQRKKIENTIIFLLTSLFIILVFAIRSLVPRKVTQN